MDNKIVFFDIDGTLAEGGAPASARVCSAIRRLRENGHYAVINTGRAKSYLYDDILNIGFDGIISAAGAHIEFGGELIYSACIPAPLLSETVHKMAAQDITVVLEGAAHILALNPLNSFPKDIPTMESLEVFDRNYKNIPVHKYTYYLKNRTQLEPLLPFLEQSYDLIIHNPDKCGEIVRKGISKATGMMRLMKYLNLPQQSSYAIGDSLNDLTMIRAAACGIAMGNSVEEIKQAADIVTAPFHEDGVAVALQQAGLI